jgi:hypothetical protein
MQLVPRQFTLRQLLLAMAGFAVVTCLVLQAYEIWIAPRLPLHWGTCRAIDRPVIVSQGNAVVIVMGDWNLSASFEGARRRLEGNQLRRVVRTQHADCWFLDVTNPNEYNQFRQVSSTLEISAPRTPIVIVISRKENQRA